MADLKITDLVSEGEIEKLQKLNQQMSEVKVTYIDVAKKLAEGLKIKVELLGDVDKINALAQAAMKQMSDATEKLNRAQEEASKTIANTTNTISRELAEREKLNRAERDAYQVNQQALDQMTKILGSREKNVRKLVELNTQLKSNKEEQAYWNKRLKDGTVLTNQYNSVMASLVDEERNLKAESQALSRVLTNQDKEAAAAEGTYQKLSQQLELMRRAYRAMTEEDKRSADGMQLSDAILDLDAHMKDLDAETGNFQRNVGNYAVAQKNVRTQMRDLIQEVATLTVQYRSLSEEEKKSAAGQELQTKIRNLTQEAAELKDTMLDVSATVTAGASDTKTFDQISEGVKLITDGFGAAEGAAHLLGLSEEDLVEVQTKLQAAFVVSNGLQKIQQTLQKESALMQGIAAIQTAALTKAVELKTAAEGKNIIVTKAATVAQKALNVVAKANPYVLLAMAILSVVGAIYALVKASKKGADEMEELTEKADVFAEAEKKVMSSVNQSAGEVISTYKNLQDQWRMLSSEHEKNEWVKNNQSEFSKLGVSVKSVNDAEDVFVKKSDAIIQVLMARARVTAYANEAAQARIKYMDTINQNDDEMLVAQARMTRYEGLLINEQKKLNELQKNSGVKFTSSGSSSASSSTPKASTSSSSATDTSAQAMKADLENRLALAVKGSEDEKKIRMELLEFEYKQEVENAKKIGADTWLVREKYLKEQEMLEQEYGELRVAQIAEEYANEQEQRDTNLTMELAGIENAYQMRAMTTEQYEKAKLDTQHEYALESTRAAIQAVQEQLAVSEVGAEQRAELEEELSKLLEDLYMEESDYFAKSKAEEIKADEEANKKRLDNLRLWMQQAQQMIGAVGDLMGSLYDNQINAIEEQEEALDEQLDKDIERIEELQESKVISDEEAEARKRAAKAKTAQQEEELEKKKAALEYKQAVIEKANKIAQIGINTAMGITSALAMFPPNIPLSITVGAIGAVQLATALAQPIKAYAKGTPKGGHDGGLALVGDGGKAEIVSFGGKAWLTSDKPQLIDLPKGAEVFPDARMTDLKNMRFLGSVTNNGGNEVTVINDYKELERGVNRTNNLLKQQMRQNAKIAYLQRFHERLRKL